jgi:hypothetical protein
LVKKPEEQQDIVIPTAAPTQPSKPEVYFIKYKTQKEAGGAGIGAVDSGFGAGSDLGSSGFGGDAGFGSSGSSNFGSSGSSSFGSSGSSSFGAGSSGSNFGSSGQGIQTSYGPPGHK